MNEQKLLRRKARAIEQKNVEELAQLCRKLGDMYHENHNYNAALQHYQEEAKAYQSLDMKVKASQAFRMVGEMYILLQNFGEALNYVMKYLGIAFNAEQKLDLQRAYATIGRIHLLQAQSNPTDSNAKKLLKKAEKNFLRSLLICKDLTHLSKVEILDMQARLYLNLGVTSECQGEYKEAIKNFEKAMSICRHNDFWELLYQCYSTTGQMYANKLNDCTTALRFLNLGISIAERLSTNRTVRVCQALLCKSEVLIKIGDFHGTKQTLRRAYKLKTTDSTDRECIESTLKIVAAMCYAETALINANSEDWEMRKKLYEKLGDGACRLKSYEAGLGYYLKMLKAAEENHDDGKSLIPIYVSLYQTYKDTNQYEKALEFMWKEYELCQDIPLEAFSTLFEIAETYQLANKPFWSTDAIYNRTREEAKKLNDKKKEELVIFEQIALRKKHKMDTLATLMKEEATLAGFSVINASPKNEQLVGEDNDEEEMEDTPNIGDEICLDDLSGDSAASDEETVKATTTASAMAEQPRMLRKRGVIAVKKNEKGETQLHRACIAGNLPLVRRLIDQGHPVNIRDNAGWMPLHEAANHGFTEVVEVLLDNGATINDKGGTSCDGVTPLHDACGNGALEVVELLLNKGANATLRTDLGSTPLRSLDDWRRTRLLSSEDQVQYEMVRDRLVQRLEKAGIKTSPEKRDDSELHSDVSIMNNSRNSRGKSVTPRKRIISNSSDSSNGSRSHQRPVLFDSEEIETVNEIIQEAFPSTEIDDEDSQNIVEPEFDEVDYAQVMRDLRKNNLENQLPGGSKYFQPVPKITKRSGILGADEIDADDWLDDDIGPTKKKRKTSGAKDFPRVNSMGSRTPRTATAVISDSGISSTFDNIAISDDDNDSVDAFSVLMNSKDISGKKRRSSVSSSNRSSRDNTWRQQTSLIDNGFTRYRLDSPEPVQSSVSSTIVSPLKANPQCPPSSISYSVKVKVELDLLNVPVNRNNADDLTIEWLAEEAAKRYYNLKGVKPVLRLTTSDGAIYENSDPLHLIFNESAVIASTVLEWVTPPLSQRYMEACAQFKSAGDPFIQSKLELIPSSQTLSITGHIVSTEICRPLFRALHFQNNLAAIDISNSFVGDDGVKHLAHALPTLTNLIALNLCGNLVTTVGIKHIETACDTHPNCLSELKELYLSFNPLQNASLLSLSNICSKFLKLETLHLASAELTHLQEFDFRFNSLCDLNLSYNAFRHDGITKAIEKLNACKIKHLNLAYCRPQTGYEDENYHDGLCDEIKSTIETLIRILNTGMCSNLQEINLSGWALNDVDCWRLMQPMRQSKMLRTLTISDNNQLSKVTLKHILETITVKELHLEGCKALLCGLNDSDVDSFETAICPDLITLSLPNVTMNSNEITTLKRMWNAVSHARGKLFARGTRALLTLKPDAFNKLWGHSII